MSRSSTKRLRLTPSFRLDFFSFSSQLQVAFVNGGWHVDSIKFFNFKPARARAFYGPGHGWPEPASHFAITNIDPAPVCVDFKVDYIIASYPLASTHIGQLAEVSYAQNYKRQNEPYPHNYHSNLNKHHNYSLIDYSNQVNQIRSNSPVI